MKSVKSVKTLFLDINEIIESIRLSLDLSQEGLARILGVSVRTVVRWEKEGDLPPALEMERFELIHEVVEIAKDIMESKEIPKWFRNPKESLAGLRAIDLLATFRGIKKVQDSLEKVRWGIF